MKLILPIALLLSIFCASPALAAPPDTARGDKMHAEYFQQQTQRVHNFGVPYVMNAEDWRAKRPELRAKLFDMLGLNPLPEKTDLKPVITGTLEKNTPEGDIVVEKLHFQSRPGLYVTANLYRPKVVKEPLPTILYVCGHSQQKKGNVSLGNKTAYQHHGLWFARNGYVCLILDSLQLGEIEGIHHGTHRFNMWWWINRGYVPAGVEAWNCIRALDYLETRPEVDKTRFGVTGRSGGGAYSWWIAALDERIKCAAPCAGITDLENHVVDGCIEGHCDCMFLHNTERWDYATVAALVSPRPLMIVNTDSDPIFPLNGVVRIFETARRFYKLEGAADKIALAIGPGGHKDIQEIQLPAFRWFNKHLQGHERPITIAAEKLFDVEQLKVFDKMPEDSINMKIHETFVAKAPEPKVPESKEAWQAQRDEWMKQLRERTFRGWPDPRYERPADAQPRLVLDAQHDGVHLRGWDFTSEFGIELRLYLAQRVPPEKTKPFEPKLVVLNVLDDQGWQEFLATYATEFGDELRKQDGADETLPPPDEKAWKSTAQMFANQPWAMAYVAPRNVGRTATNPDAKKQTQLRRRYMVLGQTLAGQQIHDIYRAIQALRWIDDKYLETTPVWLQAEREMSGLALYAALFEPRIKRLDLYDLPMTHRDGPILFNVERILDLPQAVALVTEKSQVVLYRPGEEAERTKEFEYSRAVQEKLGWDKKQLQFRGLPKP
jgi:dienelactone hydrolase